jgi:transcription elongation factor SPT6
LINGDGECSNQIRLQHILKGTTAEKEKNLKMLKYFISSGMPHAIAVSAESQEATKLVEDVRAIISELVEDGKWPTINVFLVDNSFAKVFAKSTGAESEFPQRPLLLREAISIARQFQVNFS